MNGVTSTGFVKLRLDDIKTEIENTIRARLGQQANLLPGSILSQLVGIFAEREASLWDVAQDVYDSRFPGLASDVSLDNVVAITGITRQAATKSVQRNLHLFGTVGTLIPTGTFVSVGGDQNARFSTLADVTLVAGVDEVQTISFDAVPTAGNWVIQYYDETTSPLAFDADAAAVQAALRALEKMNDGVVVSGDYSSGFTTTFAGTDGKQDQPLLVLSSNTLVAASNPVNVTVTETTKGVPQGLVDVEAENFGEVQALAFTMDTIENPISGFDSIRNLEDATVGRQRETDSELRQRRTQSLGQAGAATVPALIASLLDVAGVDQVILFENDTDVEIDGRAPHSFEAVVNGGDEDAIAQALFNTKAAGITTVGSISRDVTDSQGFSHTINFSRPTGVNIYLSLDITAGLDFPDNGAAAVEQAILDFGNALDIGEDVIVYPKLIAALNNIPGIEDIRVRINTSAVSTTAGDPALDDNLAMASNQVSAWDSARISVNVL